MVDAAFLAGIRMARCWSNGARGTLVRTEDLVAELASGRLFAALDVTDPEPPARRSSAVAPAERADYPARRRRHLAIGRRCTRFLREQVLRQIGTDPLLNVITGEY